MDSPSGDMASQSPEELDLNALLHYELHIKFDPLKSLLTRLLSASAAQERELQEQRKTIARLSSALESGESGDGTAASAQDASNNSNVPGYVGAGRGASNRNLLRIEALEAEVDRLKQALPDNNSAATDDRKAGSSRDDDGGTASMDIIARLAALEARAFAPAAGTESASSSDSTALLLERINIAALEQAVAAGSGAPQLGDSNSDAEADVARLGGELALLRDQLNALAAAQAAAQARGDDAISDELAAVKAALQVLEEKAAAQPPVPRALEADVTSLKAGLEQLKKAVTGLQRPASAALTTSVAPVQQGIGGGGTSAAEVTAGFAAVADALERAMASAGDGDSGNSAEAANTGGGTTGGANSSGKNRGDLLGTITRLRALAAAAQPLASSGETAALRASSQALTSQTALLAAASEGHEKRLAALETRVAKVTQQQQQTQQGQQTGGGGAATPALVSSRDADTSAATAQLTRRSSERMRLLPLTVDATAAAAASSSSPIGAAPSSSAETVLTGSGQAVTSGDLSALRKQLSTETRALIAAAKAELDGKKADKGGLDLLQVSVDELRKRVKGLEGRPPSAGGGGGGASGSSGGSGQRRRSSLIDASALSSSASSNSANSATETHQHSLNAAFTGKQLLRDLKCLSCDVALDGVSVERGPWVPSGQFPTTLQPAGAAAYAAFSAKDAVTDVIAAGAGGSGGNRPGSAGGGGGGISSRPQSQQQARRLSLISVSGGSAADAVTADQVTTRQTSLLPPVTTAQPTPSSAAAVADVAQSATPSSSDENDGRFLPSLALARPVTSYAALSGMRGRHDGHHGTGIGRDHRSRGDPGAGWGSNGGGGGGGGGGNGSEAGREPWYSGTGPGYAYRSKSPHSSSISSTCGRANATIVGGDEASTNIDRAFLTVTPLLPPPQQHQQAAAGPRVRPTTARGPRRTGSQHPLPPHQSEATGSAPASAPPGTREQPEGGGAAAAARPQSQQSHSQSQSLSERRNSLTGGSTTGRQSQSLFPRPSTIYQYQQPSVQPVAPPYGYAGPPSQASSAAAIEQSSSSSRPSSALGGGGVEAPAATAAPSSRPDNGIGSINSSRIDQHVYLDERLNRSR